jgi:hypothetical protein
MFDNIIENPLRDKIADALSLSDPRRNFGGGDSDKGSVDNANALRQTWQNGIVHIGLDVRAMPPHHRQMTALNELSRAIPFWQIAKRIRSHDEMEFRLRILLLSNAHHVNRVMRPWALNIDARQMEPLIAGERQLQHIQTVFYRCFGLCAFMGRVSGRDEVQSIESQRIRGEFSQNQMSNVGWVKCPTQQANPQTHSDHSSS